ncbi:porin [Aurantimonas aggregata]|uniref:Porin n=1 Tax=Aurantimonas aggregata TaxID=2047720 RepID=A0A6L9MG60_9HYPH|nr:porin [Aurantimonas aggregata]NDV86628.1 porin [Aurantimonas aggregata]
MNIKSLLLGSAAALVAVTGARAADVIVPVAPEPTDYVRVCDVYGSGFFYIPGTETCMKIGGYVRFKYIVADNTFALNDEGDDYNAYSRVRVRLNFDVREETELGTLRGFARVQAENTSGTSDAPYAMDQGYIQLGGLTMGYLDTLWTEGDGLLTDTDLPVGDIQVNRISYTYAADGFSAALSLEDDDTGDFAPDVVARLAYDGGWGSIYIAGSYDENVDLTQNTAFGFYDITEDEFLFEGAFGLIDDNEDAFAIKGGLSLKDLIAADSELKFEGSYAFDPSGYSTIGLFNDPSINSSYTDFVGDLPVEWQVGAGYAQAFGKLGIAVSGIYGETFEVGGGEFIGTDFVTTNLGSGEYYKLVGNVGYEITNNFDVLGEVSYTDIDFDGDSVDQTAGFIQFVRSF